MVKMIQKKRKAMCSFSIHLVIPRKDSEVDEEFLTTPVLLVFTGVTILLDCP